MSKDIIINGITYSGVSKISAPDADTPGALVTFYDTSDATATANEIAQGKTGYINGTKITGTNTLADISTYSINATITNGSWTGAAEVCPDIEGVQTFAEVHLTPDMYYDLPSEITVTGATYTYDNTTGEINLFNVTTNVEIQGTCTEKIITEYLTFSSDDTFKLGFTNIRKNHLKYSYDTETWNDWDGSTLTAQTQPDTNLKVVYIAGEGNRTFGTASSYGHFTTSKNSVVDCSGNIDCLLDWYLVAQGQECPRDGYTFYRLFNSTTIRTAPTLPSLNMVPREYAYMFYSCRNLTTAPALPATQLAEGCYEGMFQYCSGLTTPVELNSTQLAFRCYAEMYEYCTSLTGGITILPATTMAKQCYWEMFNGCSSLVNPPQIAAEHMAESCCSSMFYQCTSMINPPALPATDLATSCYSQMFSGCSSIVTPPELPATELATSCYKSMFSNCSSIVTSPELPAIYLYSECYRYMFSDCSSLINPPALPAKYAIYGCYYGMFKNCTALVNPPELPATGLGEYCYREMFSGCTALVAAPILPARKLTHYCYQLMFYGCTALTDASDLPVNADTGYYADYYASQMYENCTALVEGPTVPDSGADHGCYRMFAGCSNMVTSRITKVPDNSHLCCAYMFEGCSKLLSSIPMYKSTNKGSNQSYTGMYKNCTALETLVVVTKGPSTLGYANMYEGCTKIKISETQSEEYPNAYLIPAGNIYTNMFKDTGGTFTGTPTAGTTYYTSNTVISA